MSLYDDIMALAWRDFTIFAVGHDVFRQQFREETFMPAPGDGARSGLERMIDEATGYAGVAAEQFLIWVTVRHFGLGCAPREFRDHVTKLFYEGKLPWLTTEALTDSLSADKDDAGVEGGSR